MIYCVEDDDSIRDIEIYTLESAGFQARGFENGADFLQALHGEKPELVLLDIMLPSMDGVEVLKALKAGACTRNIPVIMATAKGAEYDKVRSLDTGADDYLVKPFGMMEMISRVKAVLRRAAPGENAVRLTVGEVTMSLSEHMVYAGGERVNLTLKEFELLRLFLMHPSMVYTRDQLYGSVWGMDHYAEDRTVDVHISTLRQKLGPWGSMIETVRGVGYRLEKQK